MDRRHLRSLCRLHDIDTSPGMCMRASVELSLILRAQGFNARPVQGEIVTASGTMAHWWLEHALEDGGDMLWVDVTQRQLRDEFQEARFVAAPIGIFRVASSQTVVDIGNEMKMKIRG